MSKKRKLIENFSLANSLHRWLSENIPNGQSSVAIALFFEIANGNLSKQPPSLKSLFNSLIYSEQGVRFHLKRFVDEGYVLLKVSKNDKRVRLVVATPLMMALINELSEFMSSTA
jgi:DNA-binding MarR family transcriptional regulator